MARDTLASLRTQIAALTAENQVLRTAHAAPRTKRVVWDVYEDGRVRMTALKNKDAYAFFRKIREAGHTSMYVARTLN